MVFPLESLCACLLVLAIVPSSSAFPDQGKWSFKVENVPKHLFAVQKSLYRASTVSIKITCDPSNPASANMNVLVGWTLLKSPCFQEFLDIETLTQDTLSKLYTGLKIFDYGDVYYKSSEELHPCFHVLDLSKILASDPRPLAVLDKDGIYMLIVSISSEDEKNFTVQVDMSLKGTYGYLSAVDWPFLPFYGVMCGVYVLYAVGWLLVSALQWRDLLRIQFWIGGVISLGMLEKAVYYAEYQSINYTGYSVQGAVLFAEVLSCLKRSLARLLVIIVSLGFGIVNLSQTTRTLRLRRNVVKLSLYRHFTNTLIFAVLASIVFMVWVTFDHRTVECLTDWKELWFDEGYWQLLFSVVLLVIMFLWRPTNNNQRYAFTPLLDAADDEFDEDFQQPANDAFEGMKMRGGKPGSLPSKDKQDNNSAEDDLKWVEETIPSSLSDTALPSLMDSDEEIMTVRFERNKME
ncbi:ptm1, putative [Ixodes scapularis]|uniref:Ptm1, putative n=1 Tax=Ixodes scapularis TaxID=6945 RepID=B7PQM6_IXOSC|nr:ptm1, putative [Ixodes scapularis]|eukprot:XP_002436068.1 ptm1, putative [Ixodes scapularis]